MSNLLQRLLLFAIAIPGLAALIVFDPTRDLMLINALAIAAAVGGSLEMSTVLGMPWRKSRRLSILVLSIGLFPLLFSVLARLLIGNAGSFLGFGLGASLVFFLPLTGKGHDLSEKIEHMKKLLTILVYPGFFMIHFSLLTDFHHGKEAVLLFLAAVFLNDSFAYAGGKLFGKKSSHPFLLSPNKTTVGLIFGVTTSLATLIIGYFLVPELFPSGIVGAVFLGLIIGPTVVAGDLVESALKRAAHIKDTGNVIPGRGGLLDSIDSPLFAAPIFYYGLLVINYL